MEEKNILKTLRELLDKSLTNTRPLFILNTTAVNNIDGVAIQAIGATNVTFTTLDAVYEGGNPAGLTLTTGEILYLPIKGTVKLATGNVVIYQNKRLAV